MNIVNTNGTIEIKGEITHIKTKKQKTLTINHTPQTDNPESRVKGNCKEDPPVFR